MIILEEIIQKLTNSTNQTDNRLSNLANKFEVLKHTDMTILSGGKSAQQHKGLTDLNRPARVFQYQ